MKFIYVVIGMIVMLFFITFSLENNTLVTLTYYGMEGYTIHLYLLIFISFGAGFILAAFLNVFERFRLSWKVKRLEKRIRLLKRQQPQGETLPVNSGGEASKV
ncbi:MAG: LapA family protein [Deltaproteobacteria bacterium]|nr:LapA family protein [Deltaproteobacteria bacterium]